MDQKTKKIRWHKYKRFSYICVGGVCILIACILDIEDIINAVEYYQDAPSVMLLIPICIAVPVGILVWFFFQLPKQIQIPLKLWGRGIVNIGLIVLAGWFLYMSIDSFCMEYSDVGKIVVKHAEMANMKYLFGAMFIFLSICSFISLRQLVKDTRSRKKEKTANENIKK